METNTKGLPERLCLHALSITFLHPETGQELTFTSDRLSY
jgi:23S rRNA-/tRNA-specific pseudouridylate synthase